MENSVFRTPQIKKIHELLRKPLKAEGYEVRFSIDDSAFSDALSVRVGGRLGKSIRIVHTVEGVLSVSRFNSFRPYVSDELMLEYLTELARALNHKAITFSYIKGQIDKNTSPLKKITDDDNLWGLYLSSRSLSDDYYYLNIEDNFFENKVLYYTEMIRQLNELKDNDKTVTFSVLDNKNVIKGSFYVEGFDGEIIMNLKESPLMLKIKKIDLEEEVTDTVIFPDLLERAIEQCIASVKVESLISPPKKHFTAFVSKLFYNGHLGNKQMPLVDKMFRFLSTFMSPSEIENQIMELKLNILKARNINSDIYGFKLFGKYFVLDKETLEIFMFDEKELAKGKFILLNNEYEEKRYQNELKNILVSSSEFDKM